MMPARIDSQEPATLIKHSAAIHISNSLTLIQRKLFNLLLQNAYPDLLTQETHQIPIPEIKARMRYDSKNDDPLKDALRVLNQTQLEWNLLQKDREERWGIGSCLADAEIANGVCEYSYSPKMRKLLGSPTVYARLNLEVQNTFRSKHALALWEFLEDALGARRNSAAYTISVPDFRKLMAIEATQYPEFKDLSKRVVQPAIHEINASDICTISVDVKVTRRGRTPSTLIFTVNRKEPRGQLFAGSLSTDDLPKELYPPTEQRLVQQLVEEFGVANERAEYLVSVYSSHRIKANLEHVRVRHGQGGIANLAGYACAAIEADYAKAGDTKPVLQPVPSTLSEQQREAEDLETRAFHSKRREQAESIISTLADHERQALLERFAASPACLPSLKRLMAESAGELNQMPNRLKLVFLEFVADELSI